MRICFLNWLRSAILDSFSDRTIRPDTNLIRSNEGVRVARNCRQRMRLQPQRAGGNGRIDTGLLPPRGFIATAMDLTVVAAAQRHGELIADLAAKCPALGKAQVMSIGRNAATDKARLLGHLSYVLPVPNSAGLRKGQGSLVDPSGPGSIAHALGFGPRAGRIA